MILARSIRQTSRTMQVPSRQISITTILNSREIFPAAAGAIVAAKAAAAAAAAISAAAVKSEETSSSKKFRGL